MQADRCQAILVCVVWLLAYALPVSAFAREQEGDVAYERAAHAYRLGELEEALAHVERAAQLEPDDAQIRGLHALILVSAGEARRASELIAADSAQGGSDLAFVRGLALYRSGELRAARAVFQGVVDTKPEHARAQLLLGAVNEELGDTAAARKALKEARRLDPALAPAASYRLGRIALRDDRGAARSLFESARSENASSTLARAAQRQLDALGTADRDGPWNASLTAGIEFDSNANMVGDHPFLGSRRARDMRGFVQAGVSRKLMESERVRLNVGLLGLSTTHADERDYDIQAGRAALFGSAAVAPRLNADLVYFYEATWQDLDLYRKRHLIQPALRYRFSRDHETRAILSLEERDEYFTPLFPQLDHDGRVRILGLEHTWVLPEMATLAPWGRPRITGSYRLRREDTQGPDYDSRGTILGATIVAPIFADIELTVGGALEQRRFDHESLIEPWAGKRSDRNKRYEIGVARSFDSGLRVQANWRASEWDTNVQGYSNERHIMSLSASYAFE